ncbi:hypothetical protein [uncultured Pluralibacter sp.]|uniref:hypothetical protein n=1 Tax=uncultured Pluralibacter sp. TaxID=1490864 RepID=UPI0026171CE0|nr:hypothetical protein [uncultured Pluralibacter sp.]
MTNLAAGPFFQLNPCNAVITITHVPAPGVSNAVETRIDLHQMSSSDRSVSVLFESATSSDFFTFAGGDNWDDFIPESRYH